LLQELATIPHVVGAHLMAQANPDAIPEAIAAFAKPSRLSPHPDEPVMMAWTRFFGLANAAAWEFAVE
jgi:hypothetical protein